VGIFSFSILDSFDARVGTRTSKLYFREYLKILIGNESDVETLKTKTHPSMLISEKKMHRKNGFYMFLRVIKLFPRGKKNRQNFGFYIGKSNL